MGYSFSLTVSTISHDSIYQLWSSSWSIKLNTQDISNILMILVPEKNRPYNILLFLCALQYKLDTKTLYITINSMIFLIPLLTPKGK